MNEVAKKSDNPVTIPNRVELADDEIETILYTLRDILKKLQVYEVLTYGCRYYTRYYRTV